MKIQYSMRSAIRLSLFIHFVFEQLPSATRALFTMIISQRQTAQTFPNCFSILSYRSHIWALAEAQGQGHFFHIVHWLFRGKHCTHIITKHAPKPHLALRSHLLHRLATMCPNNLDTEHLRFVRPKLKRKSKANIVCDVRQPRLALGK